MEDGERKGHGGDRAGLRHWPVGESPAVTAVGLVAPAASSVGGDQEDKGAQCSGTWGLLGRRRDCFPTFRC